jgi:MFS family permease
VSFTLYPLSLAHAGDRLPSSEDMVGLSSGMLLLYSVGAAVGPLAAGLMFGVLDGGGLFLFTAAVAAATVAFGAWRVRRKAPTTAAEQVAFVAVPRTSPAGAELDPRQEEAQAEFGFGRPESDPA